VQASREVEGFADKYLTTNNVLAAVTVIAAGVFVWRLVQQQH
jgi:hypothetical protein